MAKIIKGGTVVTGSDIYEADILIEGEKIVSIADTIEKAEAEIIDAKGCYVFPGGIDPHTHLDMPFGGTVTADDFETGTRAAAFGGTTTIVDFCLTQKGKPLKEAVDMWHKKADGKAMIDYSFHLMISEMNDNVLNELPAIVQEQGITSLKLFMAYKNVFQVDDGTLFQTLTKAKELGALVQVHAENGDVIDLLVQKALQQGNTSPYYHAVTRPPEVEAEATGRAIAMAALADAPIYVVHVSCASAANKIKEARAQGLKVWGETCQQYLVLDVTDLQKSDFEGAKYVWSPPLREKWNQEELWAALRNGSLQTVGSDQCSFNFEGQKDLGKDDFTKIPNGGPLIEDRFSILYSEGVHKGRIGLNTFVNAVSTNAAKLFGLFPKKGTIAVGSDADIVVFNPNIERTLSASTHHMNVDYNPFEGMKVTGEPVVVLSRGEVLVKGKQFHGRKGRGQYISRQQFRQY
ncbi:dihydropyrimidinase [Aneurinibacillus migulanus]|uniref:Dihydropyrimidinase n=1 Tax=Aneurinibacillus migulanus TaxID=47500 RepID=A0A0D1Y9E6_ANEMI|nr:dihydropyrimidinase [Aneurinibacillus migulanus]KIV55742.1 phenylhydantoinase [Aneurinibacillus migulanus]KON95630.1 phenylhydantoinase [Aneurinibacillus migulanus]MED0891682.1 dihydropyrimidinase [Aneurinibacillus migulanus]MED1617578.1 dihydropyrimidinase [Aneurinibacillus migulanus]SDI32391.1 dihydropyrimidinase [Aneurinibacillus migulanus]